MSVFFKRRIHLVVAALAATVFISLYFIERKTPDESPSLGPPATPSVSQSSPSLTDSSSPTKHPSDASFSEEDLYPAALELGRAGQSEEDNLQCVLELLHEYDLAIKAKAYPIGTNDEIVASLTGNNPYQQVFLPKNHPSINDKGELVDQWNVPYFFHAIASNAMEIISAGPDQIMHTADDIKASGSL